MLHLTECVVSGSCPASDALPPAPVAAGEGDSRRPQWQGGAPGGPGEGGGRPGHDEPGDHEGHRHYEALEEDLYDQHSVQAQRAADRPPGHHHLGGAEGKRQFKRFFKVFILYFINFLRKEFQFHKTNVKNSQWFFFSK